MEINSQEQTIKAMLPKQKVPLQHTNRQQLQHHMPTHVEDNGTSIGSRKGRFFVSSEHDEEEDVIQIWPTVNNPSIRKTGRFVVVTEHDDESYDEQFLPYERINIDKYQVPPLGHGTYQEPLPVKSHINDDSASGFSVSATQGVPLLSQESSNLELVEGSNRRIGTVNDHSAIPRHPNGAAMKQFTSNFFLSELQKISAQNRKLHEMLLHISGPRNKRFSGDKNNSVYMTEENTSIQNPNLNDSQEAKFATLACANDLRRVSTSNFNTSSGGVNGTTNSNLDVATANSASISNRRRSLDRSGRNTSVPRYQSTSQLQKLVLQVNNSAISISQEYDALKIRNFVLTKQLKETKKQLTEANILIDSLKQQTSKEFGDGSFNVP